MLGKFEIDQSVVDEFFPQPEQEDKPVAEPEAEHDNHAYTSVQGFSTLNYPDGQPACLSLNPEDAERVCGVLGEWVEYCPGNIEGSVLIYAGKRCRLNKYNRGTRAVISMGGLGCWLNQVFGDNHYKYPGYIEKITGKTGRQAVRFVIPEVFLNGPGAKWDGDGDDAA